MLNVLKKLSDILTKKDRRFIKGLFVFSIIISIIETVGISVIMPFVSVSMDFTLIQSNSYYAYLYNFFGCDSDVNFVILFGILLILFYMFRSIINLLYIYILARFTQGRYHILVYRLFENYMGMSYKNFINKNSSTMTKSIINEASNLTGLISSLLFMISEIFIVIFIYMMMLYVNYKITLVLTLILILNAILMIQTVSKKIKKIGIKRADVQKKFYEIINKSFRNFKLIKLNSNDDILIKEFEESSYKYAKIAIINTTLQNFPRLFLEAIGFSIIIGIIIFLVWKYNGNTTHILATISMFVLSLYRLLPSINRIMSSYNTIQYSYRALEIVHSDLLYPSEDLGSQKVIFNNYICIKNLSFEYEDNKPVLKNINLDIKRGSKIAFIGESGSGKSTLVDIIIGLYKPCSGSLMIDNVNVCDNNIKSWRKHIGYIPQSVYLFDGTVGENVVFGNTCNERRIIECLKQANIYDFLEKKEGLNTLVGEGGIMLSGGQKQRIAIARALYMDPDILVLDEATSALDSETEEKIMDEIYSLSNDKTLIIIAHRVTTLIKCEKIYKIESGELYNV